MKSFCLAFLVSVSILCVGCAQDKVHIDSDSVTIISVSKADFKSQLSAAESYQVIDVRTPAEFEKGAIEKAQNINFYDDGFEHRIDQLDRSEPVFLYCQSGGRSGKAMKVFEKLGFHEVYELNGGYKGW